MNRTSLQFVLSFKEHLGETWLQPGNYFIVIGKTAGVRFVTVEGEAKPEPYLAAQCIHLWKNQGRPIASFPFETGAGYYPLPEETFCADDFTETSHLTSHANQKVEGETPAPH